MSNSLPPDNPAGPLASTDAYDATICRELVESIRQAPKRLREAVQGLDDRQLDTKYKNWSIRQIANHIADSHVHSYIRFKWALTEETPTIKAYEEGDWVALEDNRQGALEPALLLADGLHAKWGQLLETMTPAQFERTFHHPQSGATVTLWSALNYYPWHARHHTAQILWLRNQHGW